MQFLTDETTDIIAAEAISVTTSDFAVSAMTYLSEGYDSWQAYSASDLRLDTPSAALRMMSGGESELQSVDWEHPSSFNDAEMMFSEVEQTDEIALSNTIQATNPRFCRGPNRPTTVFIDLFDSAESAWVNIYNHTVHEHCEYIHGTKLRFDKMNVRGIRFWSYPPGDPTYLEWAQLRMTFRPYSESSLGLSSQAALDVQAGLSAGIRAPEIGLGAEHLRANAMDATVRVGETLDVFARESAAMVTTDSSVKTAES